MQYKIKICSFENGQVPLKPYIQNNFYIYYPPRISKKKKKNSFIWLFGLCGIQHMHIFANLKFNISYTIFLHVVH